MRASPPFTRCALRYGLFSLTNFVVFVVNIQMRQYLPHAYKPLHNRHHKSSRRHRRDEMHPAPLPACVPFWSVFLRCSHGPSPRQRQPACTPALPGATLVPAVIPGQQRGPSFVDGWRARV